MVKPVKAAKVDKVAEQTPEDIVANLFKQAVNIEDMFDSDILTGIAENVRARCEETGMAIRLPLVSLLEVVYGDVSEEMTTVPGELKKLMDKKYGISLSKVKGADLVELDVFIEETDAVADEADTVEDITEEDTGEEAEVTDEEPDEAVEEEAEEETEEEVVEAPVAKKPRKSKR